MSRGAGGSRVSHQTQALLLRRVSYGEADLILHFFTRECGNVSALARGARRSSQRFGGALEPFHTLLLGLQVRTGELWALQEAQLARPRLRLTRQLAPMNAAGHYLGWLRRVLAPHSVELELFAHSELLLDQLNAGAGSPQACLASAGLGLLRGLGWRLELERCVVCARCCAPGRSALLSPEQGGLVCRACGLGHLKLPGALRAELIAAASNPTLELSEPAAALGMELVQQVLQFHAGL